MHSPFLVTRRRLYPVCNPPIDHSFQDLVLDAVDRIIDTLIKDTGELITKKKLLSYLPPLVKGTRYESSKETNARDFIILLHHRVRARALRVDRISESRYKFVDVQIDGMVYYGVVKLPIPYLYTWPSASETETLGLEILATNG